ncbi:MAG: thiamine-monophosphate kinase [Candidatus Heimdallarchaeota archaeon]
MNNKIIGSLGELKIIEKIEKLILKKTNKQLIFDDIFFSKLQREYFLNDLVINSDMFVSTTDAPEQMNYYQMGRKSVLMNISDLMAKGVKPKVIIISLGIPKDLSVYFFDQLMEGIIDYCKKWNLDYIGGDINKTKELIISPTVFGFKKASEIIFRTGIQRGDILAINSKFGLTSVGFDILLKLGGPLEQYSSYKKAILSVLEPIDPGIEGCILADNGLATSSIDSSDGLAKSLRDLMQSNPQIGFEIICDDNLYDKEVINYSKEYSVPLERLIFEGGEEFIQIFTISINNFEKAQKKVREGGGQLLKIGNVISDEKIFLKKNNNYIEIKSHGFEHFV